MEINFNNNNDKVTNYWISSYKNQMARKSSSLTQNTIKISSNTNHLGKYEIEETTNNNGKIFIKQYNLSKDELNQYIKVRKNNYKILQGENNTISHNQNKLSFQNMPSKNVHPEFRHNFNPQNAYRDSFNNKQGTSNNNTNNFFNKECYNPSLSLMDPSQSYRSSFKSVDKDRY